MWVVGYADIFILSRFVSDADLGTYHLASRAAFLVAVLPGGYRKALRPLQKTTMFQAVEDEYGVGEARGTQFGYFTLMLAGTMLATTVLATVVVRVAPDSYSDAAPLIPLIAGGLVAPTVYRMLNKSVKYADKRVPFIAGAVVAMVLFIGLALAARPRARRRGRAAGDDRRVPAARRSTSSTARSAGARRSGCPGARCSSPSGSPWRSPGCTAASISGTASSSRSLAGIVGDRRLGRPLPGHRGRSRRPPGAARRDGPRPARSRQPRVRARLPASRR